MKTDLAANIVAFLLTVESDSKSNKTTKHYDLHLTVTDEIGRASKEEHSF